MSDVFISYSRKDLDFIHALSGALEENGLEVWVDLEGIYVGEEFWEKICLAIEGADAFVFVITPNSVNSKYCREEIDHAVKLNKRILPILREPVPEDSLHKAIASRQWDFFRSSDDFQASTKGLINAIKVNPDWVRYHTRLLVRTGEWNSNNHDSSFLLRGNELKDAEDWLSQSPDQEPRPTALQTQYIVESRKASTRRQRVTLGAVTSALVVVTALALVAFVLYRISEQRRQISLSRQLAAQSMTFINTARADLGLLLSVEANRVKNTLEARSSLLAGLVQNRFLETFLHGHILSVADLNFSRDGSLLASSGCEMTDTLGLCKRYGVRLWDVKSHQQARFMLTPHTSSVTSLAFSPNGKLLVTGSGDHTIIVWDVVTGKQLGKPLHSQTAGVNSVDFSPDGTLLASGTVQGLVMWEVSTGRQIGVTRSDHGGSVNCVAFSPDGTLLATAGQDGRIIFWEVSYPEGDVKMSGTPLAAHTQQVTDIVFSPNGNSLASTSYDDTVKLWEVQTHQLEKIVLEHDNISRVAFVSEGKALAVSIRIADNDGEIVLLDVTSGKRTASLGGKRNLAVSPGGHLLAAEGSYGDVVLWNLADDNPLANQLSVKAVEVQHFAFASETKRVALAVGRKIALFAMDASPPEEKLLEGHPDSIDSIAFSPDGALLVSGGHDGTMIVWDGKNEWKTLHRLTGHEGPVYCIAFSSDGKLLASGSFDHTIRLWDVSTGLPLHPPIPAPEEVYAIAFNANATQLAAATEDTSVVVWDVSAAPVTGKLIGSHHGNLGDDSVADGMSNIEFSPDGTLLLSSSLDDTIVWNVATGTQVSQVIPGSFATFSPDGKILAVTHSDQILLLDVETQQQFNQGLGKHGEYVVGMTFNREGTALVSAGANGEVIVWDVSAASWRERACRIANRNFREVESARFLGESDDKPETCPELQLTTGDLSSDPEVTFIQADNYAMQGKSELAEKTYRRATQLVIEAGDAALSNEICWYGSTGGLAAAVLRACEHAVRLEQDHAKYRDSRGVARVLTDDYQGAIADFEFYVDRYKGNKEYEKRVLKRRQWIEELNQHRNPLTPLVLRSLRNEAWDFR